MRHVWMQTWFCIYMYVHIHRMCWQFNSILSAVWWQFECLISNHMIGHEVCKCSFHMPNINIFITTIMEITCTLCSVQYFSGTCPVDVLKWLKFELDLKSTYMYHYHKLFWILNQAKMFMNRFLHVRTCIHKKIWIVSWIRSTYTCISSST